MLFFLAWQQGMLLLTPESVGDFNRMFRAGHDIAGWGHGSRLLLRMLPGAPYMFKNDATEPVLTYSMRPDFLHMRVSELPGNISFLTYCAEDRKLCQIRAQSQSQEFLRRTFFAWPSLLRHRFDERAIDGEIDESSNTNLYAVRI